MMRERRTNDGTYPEVEEEMAKVEERAAAGEERDVPREGMARAQEILASVAALPDPVEGELPPASSLAEAKLRMAQQYSASARQQASRFLDGLLGPLSPLSLDVTKQARAEAIDALAAAMLGVREYAIDECAAAVEAMEAALAPGGVSPNGKPIRAAVYASGIRANKLASLAPQVVAGMANPVANKSTS